jgi:hypothetical protein
MRASAVRHERGAREHRAAQAISRGVARRADLARVFDLRTGPPAREATQDESPAIAAKRTRRRQVLLDAARQGDGAVPAGIETAVAFVLAIPGGDVREVIPCS